jgi:hypothetical protein
MIKMYVKTATDLDRKVIDVILVVNNLYCWIKEFNEHEREEANALAQIIATRFSIEFEGTAR